jgi:hypothetical protein
MFRCLLSMRDPACDPGEATPSHIEMAHMLPPREPSRPSRSSTFRGSFPHPTWPPVTLAKASGRGPSPPPAGSVKNRPSRSFRAQVSLLSESHHGVRTLSGPFGQRTRRLRVRRGSARRGGEGRGAGLTVTRRRQWRYTRNDELSAVMRAAISCGIQLVGAFREQDN